MHFTVKSVFIANHVITKRIIVLVQKTMWKKDLEGNCKEFYPNKVAGTLSVTHTS